MTTFTRYWLLQIPGWVLLILVLTFAHEWFGLPAWMGGLIFLLWLVKDAILYPFLKAGYETTSKMGLERLVGVVGVAKQDLDPEGYVLVNGELWKAVVGSPDKRISKGAQVQVTAAEGMVLTVSEAVREDA